MAGIFVLSAGHSDIVRKEPSLKMTREIRMEEQR